MKLWDKGYQIDQLVEQFTVGNDRVLDLVLAQYDLQASLAHAIMLERVGILTSAELESIQTGLSNIAKEIDNGTFVIEEMFEDVHSKIEFTLTERIGEAGKKIHSARSRNDQVLVALHLYAKAELDHIAELTSEFFDTLLNKAEKHKDVLLPGYTHLQIAMPSSFGLWFSAYAETLVDDLRFIQAARAIADQNPLGSAAGYGTSFPINRTMTTELLGFSTLRYNVVAAQMSRGKLERAVATAIAGVASTIAKFAADACLYISQNFGFITLPKELTTGSSIMPHKQNPDVFELLRAKCNKLQAMPVEIASITGNLTSGYHRDLQILKESLISGIQTLTECLRLAEYMTDQIEVKQDILSDPKYQHLFSVDAVNQLVMDGVPFRDAYAQVGKQIADGTFTADHSARHTHEGSIGNLCLEQIREKFDKVYQLSSTD